MNALKLWLAENGYELAADASDEDIKAAGLKTVADGKLSPEKFQELSETKDADPSDKLQKMLDESSEKTVNGVVGGLVPELQKLGEVFTKALAGDVDDDEEVDDEDVVDGENKIMDAELVQKMIDTAVGDSIKARGSDRSSLIPDSYSILSMGLKAQENDKVGLRVKAAIEQFPDVKTAAVHTSRVSKVLGTYGQPVTYDGREFNKSTPRQMAKVAAWFKFQVFPEHLTAHDKDIIMWIVHNEKFYADPDSERSRNLRPEEIAIFKERNWRYLPLDSSITGEKFNKALIDDSTSGGQNAVPEFFDTETIILPVLGGELSPLVNMKEVARGSAAQGFTMANVTFAAANTEGSAVNLFSTSSFIANHDTTFFRAAGFIEVGRNFEFDAVPGLGQDIVNSYSRKHGEWLDEQVAIGDGTTEPQGITVASGTTDITAQNPTTGALTITDTMNLLFGVTKAFRDNFPSRQAAFIMTDTSYKLLRSIATGVTGDTRLIFGEDVESYSLHGHPVAIVATGLGNNEILFCQCGGYRLYRRQGVRFFRESGGSTLVRANTFLIGADCRYGGQLDRGGYAAVMDSAPS